MPKSARTQTGSRFAPGRGTTFARPSFTTKRTFLAVLFLGLFAMAARNVDDPDVWWHLKTGEYIAAHKSVPHTDPFSYTRAGQPWVAHEWLTELGLYEIQRSAGFAGLILVFAAILTAAFVLLYLRCGPAAYIAGVMTLWGALAARPVWGVRPQVISLLLTSLWLFILERAEKMQNLCGGLFPSRYFGSTCTPDSLWASRSPHYLSRDRSPSEFFTAKRIDYGCPSPSLPSIFSSSP
jgi:hypothetical protein